MTSPAPVVVVGAGLGALRTAESLRGHGYAGPVRVLGEEPWLPYSRPPLTKEALAGEVDHAALAFRLRSEVDDVQWHLGEPVVEADLDERTVTTRAGEVIPYSVLVAASGVRPRRLEDIGLAVPSSILRTVVRTLEDAAALQPLLREHRRIAVAGAGFIGCEVAATARSMGCEVDVVAVDDEPMVRPLGGVLASALRRRHEAVGVRFHLGRTVASLTPLDEGGACRLELDDGAMIEADIVVEALGSDPRPAWLTDPRLDVGDGVRVDAALRPLLSCSEGLRPLDGVAVVGDLARFPNPRFGEGAWRVEHWSTPTDTGRRAGTVLAAWLGSGGGGRADDAAYRSTVEQPWEVLPTFWSDQADVHLLSYGMPQLADPDGVRVLEGDPDGDVVMGYHRGADLMGVVGVGALRRTHTYRDAIGVGR